MTLTDPRPPARSEVSTSSSASSSTRRRRLLGLLLLVGLVVVAAALSLAIGARTLSLGEVWAALVDPAQGEADVIVRDIRLPRTLLGLLVGAALGLAGALIQGHTRNPLADPGLLGVTAGAAFALVLALTTGVVTTLVAGVWFALAGAIVASVLVFALGSVGRGGTALVTLTLAGVAITALLEAVTIAIVLLDFGTLEAYNFWSVGSLAGRDFDVLVVVLPVIAVGAVLGLANSPALNAMGLGDDVARALGVRIGLVRAVGILAVAFLTGGAVAACGPIAFVGLVVPHVVRVLTGPDQRWVVPYSALAGASLLLLADVVGRVIARPAEVPVGIVLGLVGAPFFIALVRRRRLAAL